MLESCQHSENDIKEEKNRGERRKTRKGKKRKTEGRERKHKKDKGKGKKKEQGSKRSFHQSPVNQKIESARSST